MLAILPSRSTPPGPGVHSRPGGCCNGLSLGLRWTSEQGRGRLWRDGTGRPGSPVGRAVRHIQSQRRLRRALGPLCLAGALCFAGCGPGTLIAVAVVSVTQGGDRDEGDEFWGPRLEAATYVDGNGNGVADAADNLTLTFSDDVVPQVGLPADLAFELDPPGTLGGNATIFPGPTATDVVISDLTGSDLEPNGSYGTDLTSSGINLLVGQTGITTVSLVPVWSLPTPIDVEGDLHPHLLRITLSDANVTCVLDAGDMLEITFTTRVTFSTSDPDQAFQLPVSGDSFGTGTRFLGGGTPTDVNPVWVILGSGFVLSPLGTYLPTSLGPGSPSGLDVLGSPSAIADSVFPNVSALPYTSPGIDVEEMGSAVSLIISVQFQDGNDNGFADGADSLTVLFCRDIVIQGFPLADDVFALDPPGTFGPAAVVRPGTGPTEVRIADIGGTTIQPNGSYGAEAGSSGLDLLPGQTGLRDSSGTPIDPAGAFVDVEGELNPRVLGVAYKDTGGNCSQIDGGDILEVRFIRNVTLTTSDPNQAFHLPVSGDTFGTGPQILGGVPMDVDLVTIVLGTFPTLSSMGTFNPTLLGPGSPSGVDVASTPGMIVDSRYPTVSAVSRIPPGMDLEGETFLLWTSVGDAQPAARFGISVASAGDVNLDGFGDVIVGAPEYDTPGSTDAGKAHVYLGTPGGLSMTSAWTASGADQIEGWYGSSVALAGDVNGDGYSDIIVGEPGYDTANDQAGRACVYHGGAPGPSTIPDWTSSGDDQLQAQFGYSVASAGDVDNNGFDDVIVSAHWFDTANTMAGKVYLFYGGPGGLSGSAGWTSTGEDQAYAQYGQSVASAGDVDNDGYSDLIVGAFGFDSLSSNEGKVYVYLGGSGGPVGTADWTSTGDDQSASGYGWSVASAGDVDNDGFDDILVGARSFSTPTSADAGKAYLYPGGPGGPSSIPLWTSSGDDTQRSFFGASVASAGDVNSDGYGDIIVGAPQTDTIWSWAGKAHLYLGGPTGSSLTADWTSSGDDKRDAYLGSSVSSAGDVNQNGRSEVIVGEQGKAYLFCVGP